MPQVKIFPSTAETGRQASLSAIAYLRQVLDTQPTATMVMATGVSQFDLLKNLIHAKGIDWNRISVFHLDEYVNISESHPASFRRYLRQRFASHVPLHHFHYIIGDAPDIQAEIDRLNCLIVAHSIDLALIGIGENGHIAFNDPPADFVVEAPYIRVTLDEKCRRQQVGEGWFERIDDVPSHAISMSIRQIMKAKKIICTVPDQRKAEAVFNSLKGPITPLCPASILQMHENCDIYLDYLSASLLGN